MYNTENKITQINMYNIIYTIKTYFAVFHFTLSKIHFKLLKLRNFVLSFIMLLNFSADGISGNIQVSICVSKRAIKYNEIHHQFLRAHLSHILLDLGILL